MKVFSLWLHVSVLYVVPFQIAHSQNRVYLSAETLMLNLKDIEMKEG